MAVAASPSRDAMHELTEFVWFSKNSTKMQGKENRRARNLIREGHILIDLEW